MCGVKHAHVTWGPSEHHREGCHVDRKLNKVLFYCVTGACAAQIACPVTQLAKMLAVRHSKGASSLRRLQREHGIAFVRLVLEGMPISSGVERPFSNDPFCQALSVAPSSSV